MSKSWEVGRISVEAGYDSVAVSMDADCSGAIFLTAEEALRVAAMFAVAATHTLDLRGEEEP